MTPMPLHMLAPNPTGEPEHYHVAGEKLIAGNPRQSLWLQHTDASGKFFAGIWHSEIGKWRIAYTEEEYCRVLEGRSIITEDGGAAVTVGPGDSFVIPRGFTGTWEVVVPTRKTFVIYEPGG
jgi:uncharacterized cupin superfamily protein